MGKDNVDLICSVAELTGLFTGSRNLHEFLQRVVETVAQHMNASVCSVYLYSEAREELILHATVGLNVDSVGKVRLKLGEGLVGTAVKELRAIREDRGSRNPNFKFIPDIQEEEYEAFLAVPILRGLSRVGALVLQHTDPGYFDEVDTKALRAIASQLASAIESARLLISLSEKTGIDTTERYDADASVPQRAFLKGIPGSEGVAVGKAVLFGVLNEETLALPATPEADALGLEDFEQALERTEAQLKALEETTKAQAPDLAAGMIFSAHLLMLRDDAFAGAMRERIQNGVPPPAAIREIVEHFVKLFDSADHPHLREKVQDVRDLGHRMIHNLCPGADESSEYDGRIVIAGDILPSQMLRIAARKAAGLILTAGGFTAHMSILARSLDIPLVIVGNEQPLTVQDGTEILMDAGQGTIYISPGEEVLDQYAEFLRANKDIAVRAAQTDAETWTCDGVRVCLQANLNLLSELEMVKLVKAEGVGLYRSEFPYIVRNDFPSEEEQYRIYRRIIKEMSGQEVIFRTLDVGGDKMLSYFPFADESNPFLGLRAIRFSLRYQEIFAQQLRALLRAGEGVELSIMFPLISSLDDFLAARSVVSQCVEELRREKTGCNCQPRLGIMVELPCAVEIADILAEEADFLCIGTNDLVQYMLAVDRTNQQITDYYVPYHPAVLRALKRVVEAAAGAGTPLSLCGEIATDARLIPFLIGVGLRRFSMDARRIPEVQKQIQAMRVSDAEQIAENLLKIRTVAAMAEALQQ